MIGRQTLVLGRKAVDRRWDDGDLVPPQAFAHVGRAGEDVAIGVFEVRQEKGPRASDEGVGHVDADVAPPDDGCAGLSPCGTHEGAPHRGSETGGLWVVGDYV